jgi:ABC-2 type transport system permease protein
MTPSERATPTWSRQLRGACVIIRKNALLYYLKAPVLVFGIVFPTFFFLAFKMGRPIAAEHIVPAMVAMSLWFTASAVGPLVTPWERQARTYERLLASPISLTAMLAGDIASGMIFGLALSGVSVLLGLLLTDACLAGAVWLLAGLLCGAASFAALGVVLAAIPAPSPSNIMLLSNLVRLPLLFVSGIFLPIAAMPAWARWLAPLSPLAYAADLIRHGFGRPAYFPPLLSLSMLMLFTAVLLAIARHLHRLWRIRGL